MTDLLDEILKARVQLRVLFFHRPQGVDDAVGISGDLVFGEVMSAPPEAVETPSRT